MAQLLIAHEVLYVAVILLTKSSVLFVYLHIFPLQIMPRLRIAIPITMAVVVAAGTAEAITLIFQCVPINYFWDRLRDTRGGRCININIFGWTSSAINASLEVWLICLPLPELIKLRLYWRRKLRVCLMLIAGSL